MKYSRTAITELTSKYRSILRKCAFLNAAILMGALVANPANAADYTTRQVNNTNPYTFDGDSFHNSNQTGERGGAIYNTSGNTLKLIRDGFSANSADWGGAIYSGGNAPLLIYGGTSFNNNIARYEGGAIYSAADVSIFGHDEGNHNYSTGVVFTNNTAGEYPNDIYMGGSANTHLYLNLASQVHSYEYYDEGLHYVPYVDNITLNGGVDGEHYTINATSQTNSAGTSTVAMGEVAGATEVNIGEMNSSKFGKATAYNIEAGNLNMYNNSSLAVNEDVDLSGSADISDSSHLEVGGDLTADTSITNRGNIIAGGYIDTVNLSNTNGSVNATGYIHAIDNYGLSGSLINLRNSDVNDVNAIITAGGDIIASDLSNKNVGDGTGVATITAGSLTKKGDVSVGTTLENINATITAHGNVDANVSITNTNGTIIADSYKLNIGTEDETTVLGNIRTKDLDNSNGSVEATGDIVTFVYDSEQGEIVGSIANSGVSANITAGGDIDTVELSNTNGSVSATGYISATSALDETDGNDKGSITNNGGSIVAGNYIETIDLSNTNGLISAANNITAENNASLDGSLTNLRSSNDDVNTVNATITAGGDIDTYKLINKKEGTATGVATITAGSEYVNGDITVNTTITNTIGTITAYGDIDAGTSITNENGTIAAESYTSNFGTDDEETIVGNIETVALSNTSGTVSATGDISAIDYDTDSDGSLTNTGSGATITAGGFIDTVTLSNTSGTIEAGGDIYAANYEGDVGSITNSDNASITAGGYIDTITLSNTNSSISAVGSISAINSDEDGGLLTNQRNSNDGENTVNATITAGTYIETYKLINEKAGSASGVATITSGSSTSEGDIYVETTLGNTNATITAYGDIYAGTGITNEDGRIEAKSYTTDLGTEDEETFSGDIFTVTLNNTNSSVSATGYIAAFSSNDCTGSLNNSLESNLDGVNATVTAGESIVADALSNTKTGTGNGAAMVIAGEDISIITDLANTDGSIIAGGDIEAETLTNKKVNGVATIIAGGDIYGDKDIGEETTTYTGLTLNNTLGSVSAGGNIYAIGGANSGAIAANTLYLQGDTTTPRTYGNTGLIDAAIDITAGMTLTTDGIDNVTTPTKGITQAINNEGLLKVTSGKIVADVTGAGTLQVDAGKTAEINSGVTVSQNTVATAAEIADPATAAGVLTNNGTLNVNTLLDNKGEIANAGTINLNGIAIQTNAGIISGNGTLNVKTITGTETVPDKTTELTNNGLINNNVAVDAGSTFVTAASDNAVAASATSGITGAIANNGALVFNNTGYLLDNITGDNGTTTIGANVDAATGVGITQKDISIVAETGLLAIDANKIVGNVTNDNVLVLRGGAAADSAKALTQAINGKGTTAIDDGYVTSDYAINQEVLIFGDASLSINAGNIGDHVINAGALNLTGGKLSQNVNYESETQTGSKAGTVTIAGNTEFAADAIYADTVNINAGSTLTVGDRIVNTNTGNIDGTLDLHITAAAKDAETVAGSNVTINDLNIDGNAKLVVNIADGVLDAQHAKTHSVALIKGADAVFTADQIQIVSDGNYTIEVDDVNKKYVLINEDSYADTDAASGGSANNMAAAVAFDNAMGLEDGSVGREIQKQLNLVSKTDTAAYQKALTDVAPTDSAVHTGITQDFNNLIGAEVSNRLATGRSGGDTFERGGAWAQALYNHSKQDRSQSTAGFKGNTRGIAFGLDGELNKTTMIGLGYAYGRTDVDSLGRDTDIKSHNIFAYGKYQPSKWFVRGMVNYGRADYIEKANILGINNRAKYNVDNYGIRAYIGYDLDYGFTPEAGLRYTYIRNDKYTDTAGQAVKAKNVDVLTAVLGVDYSTTFRTKSFDWSPKAHVAFTYDLESDESNATVNIGSSAYDVKGKRLKRFGTEAGVATEMSVDNWDFTVGYDLGIRKDYTSHTGSLKVKYNF